MNSWLVVDINVLASAVLLVVLFSTSLQSNRRHFGTRLFTGAVVSTLVVLILEAVTWVFDGRPEYRGLVYISNFLFLLSNPVPAIFWVCYIDYRLKGSAARLRHRWFYAQPVIAVAVLMVASIPFDFVFSVDELARYGRGPGLAGIAIANYGMLAFSLFLYWRNRNAAETRLVAVLIAFTFIPAVGATIQLLLFGSLLTWASTAVALLITYVFIEVHELSRDFLTGLFTRRQIEDWIRIRMKEVKRKGQFGIIMIDLDRFKAINDSFGHCVGDKALATFSSILSHTVKRSDTVARYAGDEFLILAETPRADDLKQIVYRLRDNVRSYNQKQLVPYVIEFSAGTVLYDPTRHNDYEAVMREVDAAMYSEKNDRRTATIGVPVVDAAGKLSAQA